jgi:hypothetical protein
MNFNKALSYLCLALSMNVFTADLSGRVLAETSTTKVKEGFPIRQVGGGTRDGRCSAIGQSLAALIPSDAVGMTTKALPELFFYIPKTAKPQQVEFVMRDDRDRLVYENTNSIEKNGILRVNVPVTKQLSNLEADRYYHWYLSMICDSQDRSKDLVVEGWIKRVSLPTNVSEQLSQLKPLDRVSLYQKTNLWYDAIGALVDLKSSQLNNSEVPQKWQELLNSVGLENLAQEPIIN